MSLLTFLKDCEIKNGKEIVKKYDITSIIATHNLELTKYGDFIVNLKDGKIENIFKN